MKMDTPKFQDASDYKGSTINEIVLYIYIYSDFAAKNFLIFHYLNDYPFKDYA